MHERVISLHFGQGEETLARYWRHPITLLISLVPSLILFAFFFIAIRFLPVVLPQLDIGPIALFLIASAAFLFAWLYFFLAVIDYALDTWIVTNRRIFDIRQTGIFSRRVVTVRLGQIQDVATVQSGILPTIFSFGDVQIQSAGAMEKINFQQVPHPNEVKNLILDLYEKLPQGEKQAYFVKPAAPPAT